MHVVTRFHRQTPSRLLFYQLLLLTVIIIGLGGCDREQEPLPASRHETGSSSTAGPIAQPSRPAQHELPKIVAFGDSLTAGLGVSPAQTYPAQLQRRLDEAGYRVRVINAGVSGETSAGGLRRVDWVLRSSPRLVILELGGNDGLRGIDPNETRKNLDRIIQRFTTEHIPVVLAGMKLPPNYGEKFTARFEAIYPDLANRHGIILMPFFLEDVALHDGLTQADGIHPTGDGYAVIVDNLLPMIEPLVAGMSPAES